MSVFSALWRLIKKMFVKLTRAIGALVKRYWPVLLLAAAIWFAPQIATWLSANGAPAWVASGFSTVAATLTPPLVSGATWLATGLTNMATAAWSEYVAAGWGWQLAIAGGVAAMVAPEEFSDVVSEVGEVASDVLGTVVDVVGNAASSILGSPLGIAAGAAALYFLLSGDKEKNLKLEVNNATTT